MAESKKKPKKYIPPVKLGDLQGFRKEIDDLKQVVRKLKDILQVNDNWHSRISKMIGKDVKFLPESFTHVYEAMPLEGTLLYADRYTLGIRVSGKDRLYNKGKVEYIELA